MLFVAALVLMVPLAILRGFVLATIWRWLAVPVFDVPELSVAAAIGLALIVGYLTAKFDRNSEPDEEELAGTVLFAVLNAGLTLALGWAVLQFMPEVAS